MRTITALLVSGVAAVCVFVGSADASACDRQSNVIDRPVVDRVVRNDDALVRAAQLEREARFADQEASTHAARAQSARTTAQALEEAIPASFGDAREVILARIDALLERAALETGEMRVARVRASELRAEAQRLRARVGNGNGGWRGKRSSAPQQSSALDI
jgi:hypothetical protein